ncbi:MAG: hypothetical protein Q8Q01_00165 [archaeon]|nr:hypothetical protein [archaeon]
MRKVVPLVIVNALLFSCGDKSEIKNNSGFSTNQNNPLVEVLKGKTNSSGEVSLDDIVFKVNDNFGNPLNDILVYHLQGKSETLSIAVDEQRKYFPSFPTIGYSQYGLSSQEGLESLEKHLLEEITFVLSTLNEENGEYVDSNGVGERFLGEQGNSNRYCLSKEAMAHDYIDVPLGIVSLGKSNEEGSLLNLLVSRPLHQIFEKYILRNYGDHEGYEVWVPKTAISLCDEDYDGVVCPITSERLSQEIWQNNGVPYWHIAGSCSLNEILAEDLSSDQNNTPDNSNNPRVQPDYPVNENNSSDNDASVPGCSLNPCIKFDANHCEEPCVSVPSGNRCVYPCISDRDCENNDFPSRCYDLSIFGGQEGKGCLIIPCDEGCPVGTECIDLTEYPFQRTASGAEPAAAVFTYENCYNVECVPENRF